MAARALFRENDVLASANFMVQFHREVDLTRAEQCAVRTRYSSPVRTSRYTSSVRTHHHRNGIKKCATKVGLWYLKLQICDSYLPPLNVCERLFSKAGYTLGSRYKGISTLKFGSELYHYMKVKYRNITDINSFVLKSGHGSRTLDPGLGRMRKPEKLSLTGRIIYFFFPSDRN